MNKKFYLLLASFLLFFMVQGFTQTVSKAYEGVFSMEEPKAILLLKQKGDAYYGYLTDGVRAQRITGAFQDEVLTLVLADGNDKTMSYAALDEAGNLLVTDDQLNMAYFIRAEANVNDLIAKIEQAENEVAPAAADGSAADVSAKSPSAKSTSPSVKGKISPKYANKKFLHLYTGNGLSEKWAYYLFDDGRFYYRNFTSYSSSNSYSNFSAVMNSDDAGRWAVEIINGQEYLNLAWNDGKAGQLKIEKAEIGYLLNNNKYYLVGHEEGE